MRKITKEKLEELAKVMPTLKEGYSATYNTERDSRYTDNRAYTDSGAHVVINLNRTNFGEDSTLGHFIATAYDANGSIIEQTTGVMLEPKRDYDKESIAGSDTAIPSGSYNIIPSDLHGHSGYYEVVGVSGRSEIKIHSGKRASDTEGCLMPGTSGAISGNNYIIFDSKATCSGLFSFFEKYGNSGIVINIYG